MRQAPNVVPRSPVVLTPGGVRWLPIVLCHLSAITLTALAGLLALDLSREYYATAPYHYDSAAYRLFALSSHQALVSKGLAAALLESLHNKDSLDVSLRLLLAPRFLLEPHGHLVVLLPFLCLFVLLVLWYVFTRTRSLQLGLAVVAFLFAFPLIFNPVYKGIADYWVDNVATWLVGGALVSWLLSEGLTRPRWSFLAGLLLGLLAIQRSIAAVYAGILFLPLVCWIARERVREDGLWPAALKVAAFAIPGVLLGALVFTLQWRLLYNHYFVAGYDYGSPLRVLRYLVRGLDDNVGAIPLLVVLVVCLWCLSTTSRARRPARDVAVAVCVAVGLTGAVVLTMAFYRGFFNILTVLVIVLLATVLSDAMAERPPRVRSAVAAALVAVAATGAVVQYARSASEARERAGSNAAHRVLYRELARVIARHPPPRKYTLLFDEVSAPFLNQAYLDYGLQLDPPVGFMSIHDSYYRAAYGDRTAPQIADDIVGALEKHAGVIAAAYCEPRDVLAQPSFRLGQGALAVQVAMRVSEHLLKSPRWKRTERLTSPYGCLSVYEHWPRLL